MIILLSPAKSLDESPSPIQAKSEIYFPKEVVTISKQLKKLKAKDLQALMKISEKLAVENYLRYQHFDSKNYNLENAKQAILMFKGAAYIGLEASSLTTEDLDFAQKHLRMLSGLYGILRPYDLIQPYRLEMGTKHPIGKHDNLYKFWGDKITDQINIDLDASEGDIIVNVASQEYFKAVNPKKLNGQLINIHFKEKRDGKYKIIAFNAKKARGLMSRYIIQNRIIDAESLKSFVGMDYLYNDELTIDSDWVFVKD